MAVPPGKLVVTDLCKTFEGVGDPLQILTGVNLQMERGDAIAVTGPSGSGKSTLLYILGTLDTPSSGSVSILDRDPFALNAKELSWFRSESVGFIFQDHHLLPQLSVLENVVLPMLVGTGADDHVARAKELLERVGLSERLSHRPAKLSGGERQRVAVCRALINQPALVLADEPTGNLDPETAGIIGKLLLEIASEQSAMLVCVTHSRELAGTFPRELKLRSGKLVEDSQTATAL
jgi:lipoprotein-releasing system ATP-binding protein